MDWAKSLRLPGNGAITTLTVSSPIRSIAFAETDDGLIQGNLLWYLSQFIEKYSILATIYRQTNTTLVCTETDSGNFLGFEPQDLMHHLPKPGQVQDV